MSFVWNKKLLELFFFIYRTDNDSMQKYVQVAFLPFF